MKTSISKVYAALFTASFLLMTACGGDGGSNRRLPGSQLNLQPDQIDIIQPAHNAMDVCRFADMIIRIADDPNCDSADVYTNVGEFMAVSPAGSFGTSAVALTQGYANPAPNGAGCDITFRMSGRPTANTDLVLYAKGTPTNSIGINKQSAKFKTGNSSNSSCGDEAFFYLSQVIVGGRAYAQNNSAMENFATPIEELVGEDADGDFTINTTNLAQSFAQIASTMGLSFFIGLGTVGVNSQTQVTFEAEVDEYSAQYGFRMYQVPGVTGNPLNWLFPTNWVPVDLTQNCVQNPQFGGNGCSFYQSGLKHVVLINPQSAGYVSGTGYVLLISRGMTSPSGRVLKKTYMIPFVTQ